MGDKGGRWDQKSQKMGDVFYGRPRLVNICDGLPTVKDEYCQYKLYPSILSSSLQFTFS